MSKKRDIPKVTQAILSIPYVKYLLGLITGYIRDIREKDKKIEDLEEELRRLKKQPKKPKISPSKLDEEPPSQQDSTAKKKSTDKRPGSKKRKKKKDLPIDEIKELKVESVPEGWKLVGHKPYVIQDIKFARNNIRYDREIWRSPEGEIMVAELPKYLRGRSFGPYLRSFVINLYNNCHVTQPLIWQQLRDIGVDISRGQINHILNGDKDNKIFEQEILEVVEEGIRRSDEIRTDDTGARHQGKNAFCNCINTDLFTYFTTTTSKSRINFLEILQLEKKSYRLNDAAMSYCTKRGLSPKYTKVLSACEDLEIKGKEGLELFFQNNNIEAKYARRIITEGLLLGALIAGGFDANKFIHADGAGQFKMFNHSLCWKHAERPLKKVVIRNDIHQQQWDGKMNEFWQLYQDLKKYKAADTPYQQQNKESLSQRFDKMCESVQNFAALNQVLEELAKKKAQLMLVLDFPFISLHNNDTEREIREYSKRRKISGSTRSESGKKSRDIFTSLKKTCRKLDVSFWEYIVDRIKQRNQIPPLVDILTQRS